MNFLYADVDGHIGYTATGAIPIRPRADGLRPVSGDGGDEWSGFIPFASLPRTLDPPRGYIVTANNRVVSARYPFPLARDGSNRIAPAGSKTAFSRCRNSHVETSGRSSRTACRIRRKMSCRFC